MESEIRQKQGLRLGRLMGGAQEQEARNPANAGAAGKKNPNR